MGTEIAQIDQNPFSRISQPPHKGEGGPCLVIDIAVRFTGTTPSPESNKSQDDLLAIHSKIMRLNCGRWSCRASPSLPQTANMPFQIILGTGNALLFLHYHSVQRGGWVKWTNFLRVMTSSHPHSCPIHVLFNACLDNECRPSVGVSIILIFAISVVHWKQKLIFSASSSASTDNNLSHIAVQQLVFTRF